MGQLSVWEGGGSTRAVSSCCDREVFCPDARLVNSRGGLTLTNPGMTRLPGKSATSMWRAVRTNARQIPLPNCPPSLHRPQGARGGGHFEGDFAYLAADLGQKSANLGRCWPNVAPNWPSVAHCVCPSRENMGRFPLPMRTQNAWTLPFVVLFDHSFSNFAARARRLLRGMIRLVFVRESSAVPSIHIPRRSIPVMQPELTPAYGVSGPPG